MTADSLDPDTWIDLYADALFQYAMARVRNADLAEDLVQETFLAALKGVDRFQGQSSVQTWLTAILKHKIQDYFRTKWRELPITDMSAPGKIGGPDGSPFDEEGHWVPGSPRTWPEAGRALLEADFIRILRGCLKAMPSRLATVFTLREIDELPAKEVCSILQVTDQNYWALMHRARGLLRSCMEKHWFESEGGHH